jgi:predicted ArsR family transcriptional regulator
MSEHYTRFDAVFFEKTRLSIVTALYREERSFNELKADLGLSDGALYAHMEKLVESGYAEKAKVVQGDSARTMYRLTARGALEFDEYLKFLERMLGEMRRTGEER